MKRSVVLAGSVVLGSIVTVFSYCFLVFGILHVLVSRSGRSPESYLGVAFLIFLPISIFLGSFITGYFASRYVKGAVGCLGIAPGLCLGRSHCDSFLENGSHDRAGCQRPCGEFLL